jgi:hypothetical protein
MRESAAPFRNPRPPCLVAWRFGMHTVGGQQKDLGAFHQSAFGLTECQCVNDRNEVIALEIKRNQSHPVGSFTLERSGGVNTAIAACGAGQSRGQSCFKLRIVLIKAPSLESLSRYARAPAAKDCFR